MGATVVARQTVPDDLLLDLKQLGFTEYEARVYFQLLLQSPATAYEVAKASGVPRPNTYNALEALSQRGGRSSRKRKPGSLRRRRTRKAH